MDAQPTQFDYIGLWGAFLATVLAIREIVKSRIKVNLSFDFSDAERGNHIKIRNLSDRPIIIEYWRLSWCKRERLRWIEKRSRDPGPDAYDLCIEPHTSKSLSFVGPDHFDWGHKAMAGQTLFVHLHIVGKKCPVKIRLYG